MTRQYYAEPKEEKITIFYHHGNNKDCGQKIMVLDLDPEQAMSLSTELTRAYMKVKNSSGIL